MKIIDILEEPNDFKAKWEKRLKHVDNLVAKHARKFNKAAVHKDRKHDYERKPKFEKQEGDE